MTEYELEAVGKAVERSLVLGAPGISQVTRGTIRSRVILRLRHEFNVPAPTLKKTLLEKVEALAAQPVSECAALTKGERR